MQRARVAGVHESDGQVMVTLRLQDGAVSTLPCVFEPLLEWRRSKKDDDIVKALARRAVYAEIRDGCITRMETSRWGARRTWPQRPTPPPGGGLRVCPNCHKLVKVYETRQGGKRVYRCPDCHGTVGTS